MGRPAQLLALVAALTVIGACAGDDGAPPFMSWQRVGTFTVEQAGAATLDLEMADDGVLIDKLVLLPVGAAAPAGFGPAETL